MDESSQQRYQSSIVTEGIQVEVESRYIPEHSDPHSNYYFFSYQVRISNVGRETAKLLTRHWIVTNATGKTEEVRGPGVVGQTPSLEPGESFEYTSFCPLDTNFGTMHGSYQMVRTDGRRFDAQIETFVLASPGAAN